MPLDTSHSNLNFQPDRKLTHKSQKGGARWGVWLLAIAVLVVGGVLVHPLLFAPKSPPNRKSQIVPAVRQNLAIAISANGVIKPELSVNVSPKTAGILKERLVQEGDSVEKGQIIAYMDDSTLRGQLVQAQGRLASAQANLQKLEAGKRPQEISEAQAKVDEAQAKLRKADQILRQNQTLFDAGAISRRTFQDSQAERDATQAQVSQAEQFLSLQEAGTRVEEIAQARADVVSAQGSLQQIQAQLDDTIIRAPFSGVVLRVYADPGAFVTPTTAASSEFSATSSSILSLASENRVVADVAETNIARIKVGQKVIIRADAYPDKTFEGRVAEIAPQSTLKMNVTSFEVKVAFSDPKGLLHSGMNTDVEFQVGELDNALVVPTVAIVREASGTGVYVEQADGKAVFRPIETGVTVGNQTEVRSGIEEGEQILLTSSEGKGSKSQDSPAPGGLFPMPAPPPPPPG